MDTLKKLYKRFYPRINTRVTIPFLLMTLLIGGVAVFIVTRLVSGSIQERLNTQLRDSAVSASNAIVEVERQLLESLRSLVFTDGVADALERVDFALLNRLLSPIVANADLDETIVFDGVGNNLYRLSHPLETNQGSQPSLLDTINWPGVQRVVEGQADSLGDKFIDIQSIGGEPTFFISAPVFTADGTRLVGGIGVGIYLPTFVREVSDQSLANIVILRANGDLLGTTFRTAPANILMMPLEKIASFMQMADEISPVEETIIDAQSYQMVYTPFQLRSQEIGLMGVGLSTDFVIDRISTSRDTFALLFGVLLVGVIVMGILVARSIIRPVYRLVETTRAIQSGNLDQRVGIYSPDELGELGRSFDHMTAELIKRNNEIGQLYLSQVEETARRDTVLSSISDIVIVLDLSGRAILMNESARFLIQALRPNKKEYAAFLKICNTPQLIATPVALMLLEHYFSVLANPVNDPDGNLLGYVIVFRDVTEIIRAEKLKDELILQLSHELRTPLTAVQGYLDLANMFTQSGNAPNTTIYIDKTSEQVGILRRMIDEVVDVSAILANQFTVDVKSFALDNMLQDLINRHRTAIEAAQLQIHVLLPTQKLWIEGDELRLGQAIEQILMNAYYYTLPGGWIEVGLEKDETGKFALITIVDTGVGIAPEEIELVFERMYRGHSAEAGPTDRRGLGLGLYLARHIVDLHQGNILIESQVNLGTVVTLKLPIVRPKAIIHEQVA